MKIGYLITYLGTGGAQGNCLYLAKEMAKKHDVTIFTSYKPFLEKAFAEKPPEMDFDKIIVCKPWFKWKYYFVFNPSVFKILKYKLDVLHVHSFGFFFNDLLVVLLKLFTKTKVVNTPHGPFMALSKYSLFERIIKFKFELFEWFINKLYNFVIQVNDSQWKWMVKKGVCKDKIRYVPNGIPESLLEKASGKEKNDFIKKYNLKDKFVISYLGRIQKYKGIDQVIKILPNLLRIKKNLTFLVAGKDVGDKERLLKLVKKLKLEKNIKFLSVSDKEKEQLYSVSEIFILPSDWEAFGIVLLEAMAKGCAVISTRTEGGEFLIKEDNGCLFDFGNLKELKKCFVKLFDDKLRERIKRNNFEKAKEFTWEKIGKDLEKVYKLSFHLNKDDFTRTS